MKLWELAVIQGVLLSVQGLSYLAVQRNPRTVHDMEGRFDKKIPLVPQTVFVYVLWFPLLALFPIGLYYCSEKSWMIYMVSTVIDIAISLIIYRLYPTSFDRPKVGTDTFSGKVLNFMYIVDYKGLNCMPSMHCSTCFIIIFAAITCTPMAGWIQAMVCLLALMIVASTVLTKQHVIIDMTTALPLAAVCFGMGAALCNSAIL